MRLPSILLSAHVLVVLLFISAELKAQKSTDSTTQKKYQARPPKTQPFGKEAFQPSKKTEVRWLGLGGFLINSRGTTLMLDPLLEGFDMPILIDFPIKTTDVPRLDAVLITHSDNDHFSIPTNKKLATITKAFHSTIYVDSLMKNEGFPSFGHNIGEVFNVDQVRIKMLPVDHAWQNAYKTNNSPSRLNLPGGGVVIFLR